MEQRFIHNYAVNPEEGLIEQLHDVAYSRAYEDCDIVLCQDGHIGASGPVGFVTKIHNRAIPATIGVDVACRVSLYHLKGYNLNNLPGDFFEKFDAMVHKKIPTGFSVRQKEHKLSQSFPYANLYCYGALKNVDHIRRSMGTLGGGNHMAELETDDSGDLYLLLHCGSRNLGKQIAEYYQNEAINQKEERIRIWLECRDEEIATAKKAGEYNRIQDIIEKYKRRINNEPSKELCYISGITLDNYLHDMLLCNEWSKRNHEVIYQGILTGIEEICND